MTLLFSNVPSTSLLPKVTYMLEPTPLAQLKVIQHYRRPRALLLSSDGREEHAQWVPVSMLTVHHYNRNVLVITLPEWLAVKKGFIEKGRLTFGDTNVGSKFSDKSPSSAYG